MDLPGLERLEALDPGAATEVRAAVARLVATADASVSALDRAGAYAATAGPAELLALLVDDARRITGAAQVVALRWTGPVDQPHLSQLSGDAGSLGDELPSLVGVSRTLVGEATRAGRPVWSDGRREAATGSLLAAGVAGCVPVGSTGALYVADPAGRRIPAASRARLQALCRLAAALLAARRAPHVPPPAIPGLVGDAAAMRELRSGILAFAPVPWPVLVLGETGTGKEVVARALHALSPRANEPFVAFNAGAVPPDLVESVLFGHARGAYTGADRAREGLCARVGRGTLFLDEVGELGGRAQVALLRLLQERRYEVLGGDGEVPFEGRVVAATWRPLDDPARRGEIRDDLFHRIGACVLRVPPLRERREDLPALAAHLLARLATEVGDPAPPPLGPAALATLAERTWPGNVRELENALRGAWARARADGRHALGVADLGPPPERPATAPPPALPPAAPEALPDTLPLLALTEAYQRRVVREALERSRWNRADAAARLGVSRQWLHRLLARWGGAP